RLWSELANGRAAHSRRRKAPKSRLLLEKLEERSVPAVYNLVTSRAALVSNDSIDWGDVGPEDDYVSSPFAVQTVGLPQRNVGVWKPGPVSFAEENEGGLFWRGNFTPGDHLLYTYDSGDDENPIMLGFGPA